MAIESLNISNGSKNGPSAGQRLEPSFLGYNVGDVAPVAQGQAIAPPREAMAGILSSQTSFWTNELVQINLKVSGHFAAYRETEHAILR